MNFNELQILLLAYNSKQLESNQVGGSGNRPRRFRKQMEGWALTRFTDTIVKNCEDVLGRHEGLGMEVFKDDHEFRATIGEMLGVKAWALQMFSRKSIGILTSVYCNIEQQPICQSYDSPHIPPSKHVNIYPPAPDSKRELDDRMYPCEINFSFSCCQMKARPGQRSSLGILEVGNFELTARLECLRFCICFQPKNKIIREQASASPRSLGPIEPRLG
jgi:hypothetical protein